MKVGIIGAGRIGKVHAKNISMFVPEMEIKTIADPFMNEQTEAFAKSCGIPNTTKDANDILNDPEIEAVLICSSTDTHSRLRWTEQRCSGCRSGPRHSLRSRIPQRAGRNRKLPRGCCRSRR